MSNTLLPFNRLSSVIIPTYNRADKLLNALDSVKSQNYRPIEIILVDDGSSDNTAERVNQWRFQNEELLFSLDYIQKENGGPSSCRNYGIQRAKGDYIYFLDSDDLMHSNLLTDAINILEEQKADCVIFGFDTIGPSGRRGRWIPSTQPVLMSFVENNLWGYTSSSLKTAKLVEKTGLWSEAISIAEDYEFLGRSLLYAKKPVVLEKSLLTVSREGHSLGSGKNTERGLQDRLIAEKSIMQEMVKRQSMLPNFYLSLYSDRLLKMAMTKRAEGAEAFAKEVGAMALGLGVKPSNKTASLRRMAWLGGRWSCWMWHVFYRYVAGVKVRKA